LEGAVVNGGLELPKAKRGERLYLTIVTEGGADPPAPQFAGPKEKSGATYLFLFPFDLYVADDLATQTSFVDHTEVRIHPPFLNDPDGDLPIPQIEVDAIPNDPPAIAPDYNRVRLKNFARSAWFAERRNALRVDLLPDQGASFAATVVEDWLGLVRWWTRQWWVGRDRRHQEDYLRNGFDINGLGERLGGVVTYYGEYGGFAIEEPLTLEHTRNIRGNLTNGRKIPLSWDVFLDAIYFHASRHVPRAVLNAAIACEARIGEDVARIGARETWSKSKIKMITGPNDFVGQLHNLEQELAVTFQGTEADQRDWLEALRTCRGNVAHGSRALYAKAGATIEASNEDVFMMLDATLALSNWLNEC
jgi:hypothetical protein